MEKTAEQLRREHLALEGDTHGKNKWAILFTVLIMTFMVCLDSTVVTVALPVMQKELGVGLDRIQLVSSVYLLATCVAMLPFGRLGDVRGKVNVFQLGVIVFSVGSLLCGLSASLEVLILARIVQGIGCAAAMANNMGIITESFPARERGRAMGILATFVALGMMCGPVLGGMLVASFPWESIFLINLPIGVISFIVGLYTLPHVKPEAGERPMSLAEAARRCFANSAFTINLACMLIVFVGIGASEFILPFYFQDAHGFGSDISGLLFLALPMVNAFIGPLSGTVSDRVGCEGPTAVGLGVLPGDEALLLKGAQHVGHAGGGEVAQRGKLARGERACGAGEREYDAMLSAAGVLHPRAHAAAERPELLQDLLRQCAEVLGIPFH